MIHVGHSTGSGEVASYIGRFGAKRVAKTVLIGSVTPLMLRTAPHPGGLPMKRPTRFVPAYSPTRSQFYTDLASGPFFGAYRPNTDVSQGMLDSLWLMEK